MDSSWISPSALPRPADIPGPGRSVSTGIGLPSTWERTWMCASF